MHREINTEYIFFQELTLNAKPRCLVSLRVLTTSAYAAAFLSMAGLSAIGTSSILEGPDET